MNDDELQARMRRIYSAINAAKEYDMNKLPAKITKNGGGVEFFQDFSGGLSDEEIQNIGHTVIHNIANLQDHLRRWAKKNGKDPTKVTNAFDASQSLQLIQDLSNNDKHGYPPRNDDGFSRLAPRILRITRVMRMSTGARAGSGMVMTFGSNGIPQVSGDGTAYAHITGEVVDKDGKKIGDLFEIEQAAVADWENLLLKFGIVLEKI